MWQEDVCTRCLYTICRGLSAQHLFGVSMVSIGRHPNWGTQPPLGQTGPSIAPENWYVGETLLFNVNVFWWRFSVITTALWSRDGSAVVSLHPPAASIESSVRFL